jgi:lysophospholipase L1-like esterase
MRVVQGRGDWLPRLRIEGLRRYAFIGDSHTYGAGVAPDQTLSAVSERQLNELLPACPVEAVNLGVSGYNLWNSWLAFKQVPQVYDGVVLTLCCNDADLFGRVYNISYSEPHQTRWEGTHPIGEAVARCFDDIALFSQQSSLPLAVVYFNVFDNWDRLRIAEIIGNLCSTRGLPFIDAFALFRDRKFARADLLVSLADFHPSPKAHEAMGRHLVATLRRRGWFGEDDSWEIGAAPDRIFAAARAMVESDHYPPDAALNWALAALETKSLVARRMQASGEEDGFGAAAARTAEALNTASRRWHAIHRVRALVGDLGSGGQGLTWGMSRAQEERLKLEEVCFALATGQWGRLTDGLLEPEAPQQIAADAWPLDAAGFFDECSRDLLRVREALSGLRSFAAPAAAALAPKENLILADVELLGRLAERVEAECAALKEALLRTEKIFNDARRELSEAQIAHVSSLIRGLLKELKDAFVFVPRWFATIAQIQNAEHVPFTTAEVTLCADPIPGRPICSLGATVEYSVPNRLAFTDSGSFWADSTPTLLKLRLPTFYAGRLILRPWNSKAVNRPMIEAKLVKVVVYNRSKRRVIEPTSFYRDRTGRFVSPPIFLP